MRPPNKRKPSPLAARILAIAGVVLVLSVLLDSIVLMVPPQFQERQWLLSVIAGIVDRGIVALVGLSLLFAAFWINDRVGAAPGRRPTWQNPRFWTLALASFFGLIFLILMPLQLNGIRLLNAQAVSNIEEQAASAQEQLDAQVEQQSQQLRALLDNPEQVEQLVASGQIPEQLATQLETLQGDPGQLDTQAEEFRQQTLEQIEERKAEALAQANSLMWRGMRTGLSSLLLAVGFLAIAWMGLRSRGRARSRKA